MQSPSDGSQERDLHNLKKGAQGREEGRPGGRRRLEGAQRESGRTLPGEDHTGLSGASPAGVKKGRRKSCDWQKTQPVTSHAQHRGKCHPKSESGIKHLLGDHFV